MTIQMQEDKKQKFEEITKKRKRVFRKIMIGT